MIKGDSLILIYLENLPSFLEEHLPEEPPIDYEKEGVNMEHLFVLQNVR